MRLLTNQPYLLGLRDHLKLLVKYVRCGAETLLIAFLNHGFGRLQRWQFARKALRGQKIVLDNHYPTPTLVQEVALDQRGDISPNTATPSRKSRIMKRDTYPKAEYTFEYQATPLSGNLINGLGETTQRRPRQVFHTGHYRHEWGALQRHFDMITSLSLNHLRSMFQMGWFESHNTGLVVAVQQSVDDPQKMSTHIKAIGQDMGAVLVGITELKPEYIYEGVELPSYRYAISFAIQMDRERMLHTPSPTSMEAIFDGYRDATYVAVELAKHIRGLGWDARGSSNVSGKTELLHIPIAVAAGIGQLGKHGSLITKEYGSNVRLGTVVTNLPLTIDAPVDIGVDEFCTSCQICTTNCPPHAILDTKQMVRGVEKWYVNFDTCIPYFVTNNGCGICIEVCPWSEQGRGASISQKMLEKRVQQTQ